MFSFLFSSANIKNASLAFFLLRKILSSVGSLLPVILFLSEYSEITKTREREREGNILSRYFCRFYIIANNICIGDKKICC
jgi:hypothetical protein